MGYRLRAYRLKSADGGYEGACESRASGRRGMSSTARFRRAWQAASGRSARRSRRIPSAPSSSETTVAVAEAHPRMSSRSRPDGFLAPARQSCPPSIERNIRRHPDDNVRGRHDPRILRNAARFYIGLIIRLLPAMPNEKWLGPGNGEGGHVESCSCRITCADGRAAMAQRPSSGAGCTRQGATGLDVPVNRLGVGRPEHGPHDGRSQRGPSGDEFPQRLPRESVLGNEATQAAVRNAPSATSHGRVITRRAEKVSLGPDDGYTAILPLDIFGCRREAHEFSTERPATGHRVALEPDAAAQVERDDSLLVDAVVLAVEAI